MSPVYFDNGWFTLWFTLCSFTGRRCNQQGLGLSGLVHEKAHPVVPDMAQSRLECIDAGCMHRPLVQQIPPIIAPGLNQFGRMTPSTFTICIQDKKLMKWNTTKPSKHFENLDKILSISSLLQGCTDRNADCCVDTADENITTAKIWWTSVKERCHSNQFCGAKRRQVGMKRLHLVHCFAGILQRLEKSQNLYRTRYVLIVRHMSPSKVPLPMEDLDPI